jgi:hypothetical protein
MQLENHLQNFSTYSHLADYYVQHKPPFHNAATYSTYLSYYQLFAQKFVKK